MQNDWAAYQFDAAVMYVGLVIENAIQDRHKVGNDWLPRYTINQVVEPDFRLPSSGGVSQGGLKQIAAANPEIVGRWKQTSKAA